MAKSKRKRVPKTVLKLPDLEQSKSAHYTFQLCHCILTLRGLYIPRWTELWFGDRAR
jgi:hypothetical protein